jgi:hypothetical protein
MTSEREPPRLRIGEDVPRGLSDALEAARDEIPRAEKLEELAASFAPFLAARPSQRPLSRPPAARFVAASAAGGMKALIAAVVFAASVGGAVRYFREAKVANVPAPSAVESAAPEAPRKTAPSAEHAEAVQPAPPESAAPEPTPAATATSRAASGAREPATSSVAPSPAAPSAGTLPDDNGSGEIALLERAYRALAQNPSEALALTEEDAKRYPSGALVQEREFVAIEALVALGRTSEADARIDQFRGRFPGSAHLRRLERLRASANGAPQ